MIDDLKIHEKLSELLYKDVLGIIGDEERKELTCLLDKYGLRGLERNAIIARLEESDVFNGEDAYRKFKKIKAKRNSMRHLGWWISSAASVAVLLVSVWWLNRSPVTEINRVPVASGVISPGQSCAIVTLANGKQIPLEHNMRELEESDGTILRSESGELIYKASAENSAKELMYNTVTIPRGGEYRLELADGTRVWLNADSELKFPVNFSGDTRDVYLKGEAYFQVTKDEGHTFKVHTSMGIVQVLGTSFNVRNYMDEHKVVTTLETGKVVYISDDSNKQVIITPGYQVMEEQVGGIEKKQVDVMQYIGWREGKYVFEDISLENIMQTLERWYDIEVVYLDQSVKKYHFTGDLERYESINVFLDFIATGGDVKFKTEGKTIIIDKK